MSRKPTTIVIAGISDDAVKKATGCGWDRWCKALDRAGGRKMTHKEIVAVVNRLGAGPWWGQMVAVGYEQSRGLRQKHERPDGYSVSRSKTVYVPLSKVYAAWADERTRRAWLRKADFIIRKATRNKSMRITWNPDNTRVEVMFYAKGAGKASVTVQHNRLSTNAAAGRMKKFWGEALDRLAAHLAT